MIDYKLAKQLKDKGFSQNLTGNYHQWDVAAYGEKSKKVIDPIEYQEGDIVEELIKIPSLSELIEACDKKSKKGMEFMCIGRKERERTWFAKKDFYVFFFVKRKTNKQKDTTRREKKSGAVPKNKTRKTSKEKETRTFFFWFWFLREIEKGEFC